MKKLLRITLFYLVCISLQQAAAKSAYEIAQALDYSNPMMSPVLLT